MPKYFIGFIYFFILCPMLSFAQNEYEYRVTLKDKGVTNYTIDQPQAFLSKKAIDRRIKQGIAIDQTDLPISQAYISEIAKQGCTVIAKSKWLMSVAIDCTDTTVVQRLRSLNFVKDVRFVWQGLVPKNANSPVVQQTITRSAYYGQAYNQLAINNGEYLHQNGYKGDGMTIAIIDDGYKNVDNVSLLNNITIEGRKDFIYHGIDMYSDTDHGTEVLSCLASNQPNLYVGTAPDAKYWLLRSEDTRSEYPVEEDYWAAAAEYADSVGVDMINSSLGYSIFDQPATSINLSQLDGNTTLISIAAQMATKKGIFVVVCAGNEGNNSWRKITAPADAANVLTVGSIAQDSTVSVFSSRGYTSDLRVKPDVMALGENVSVINGSGTIVLGNGTSFAAPIMCGLVACLWQANPTLTNTQLLDVVRKSSNHYLQPDENHGYGIPNMEKAMQLAQDLVIKPQSHFTFNSQNTGCIQIVPIDGFDTKYDVRIIDLSGRLMLKQTFVGQVSIDLHRKMKSIYIISISSRGGDQNSKLLF